MLSLPRLLAQLRTKGVELSLSEDQLRYRASSAEAFDEDAKNAIRARRDEIIQFLRAREAAQRPPILRTASKLPSYGQKLWWAWITAAPTPPPPQMIHVVKTFRDVDAASVERAIRELLRRYDNLRARFRNDDGELIIQLNDPGSFQIEIERFSAPEASSTDALIADGLAAYAARNMLVSDDWLTRAKIFIAGNAVTAILSVNHLLIDGPSQAILSAELDELVRSGVEASSQDPEKLDFFDYSEWEYDWFTARGNALTEYWRHWYASVPALQNRSTRQDIVWHPGRRVPYIFDLPQLLTKRVRSLAADLSSTPFLVYFTAFAIALSRWSGQEHFGVRSAGDGRMQDTRLSLVVGCMTMVEAVEIDLDLSGAFADHLKAIEIEYRAAWQMRLPSLHAYPPFVVDPAAYVEDAPNKLAVQINYHPPGSVADLPEEPEKESALWPPALTRLEALYWTHPILAIALDIMDRDGVETIGGMFRFNSDVLTQSDCDALMSEFFAVLAEYVLPEA